MTKKDITIEKRLENMKNIYLKFEEAINSLPDDIPLEARDKIKKFVLSDKELKQLINGINEHRAPRILLVGRTGVGKSSLINALLGAYVAKVSDTKSCTETTQIHRYKDGDRHLMDILDSRGFAESIKLNDKESAENMLIRQVNEFLPDVAIMMLNCTHRDDIIEDINLMKKVVNSYEQVNKSKLPIVVVVNKCDQMAPSTCLAPDKYPLSKINKINEVVTHYDDIISKEGLIIDGIVPVSSLIEWQTPDGRYVTVEEIEELTIKEVNELVISFDGRYNLEYLRNVLDEVIVDYEAKMGLMMASRLVDVVKRISKRLVSIFSGISMAIALTPIPLSDIYILLMIQIGLVSLIISLSGRDVSFEAAKEFIFSLGGIVGAGFGFKLIAQQASKILNTVWPGAGSSISASVASSGTYLIGNAAISYYIDNEKLETIKYNLKNKKSKFN